LAETLANAGEGANREAKKHRTGGGRPRNTVGGRGRLPEAIKKKNEIGIREKEMGSSRLKKKKKKGAGNQDVSKSLRESHGKKKKKKKRPGREEGHGV